MKNIYDLIENYTFDALSAEQQTLVLSEMSRTEYKEMRQVLMSSKTAFQGEYLVPHSVVEQNLSQHFNQKYGTQNRWNSWLSVTVPLWFWLLSMATLAAFFMLFYKKTTVVTPAEPVIEKVYVHEVDTIYIEKETKKSTKKVSKTKKASVIKNPSKSASKKEVQPSPQKPIAQSSYPKPILSEIPISGYDSALINSIENHTIGQQLSDDIPEIEVKVW